MLTDREPAPQAPQISTMGLLAFLNAHPLDDDYAEVAGRAGAGPGRPSWWTMVALAAFALLLLTAATQTSRNSVADASERAALIKQISERKAAVTAATAQTTRLQAQVATLTGDLVNNNKLSSGTRTKLQTLSLLSGTSVAGGSGVSVTVDDAPHATTDRSRVLDSDLQQLANGLWEAGAEAISINGQRLTNLSSIRQAGSAITVNFISLARPYVVLAIGNPATLPTRFAETSSGSAWLDLQQQVGLEFTMRTRTGLQLPAANTPTLRFATVSKEGSS